MSETGRKIISEVMRIARENPHHVYPEDTCMYQEYNDDDGSPRSGSCIMGKALWNLGYLPVVADFIEGNMIGVVLHKLGLQVAPQESSWLIAVQKAQDGRLDEFEGHRLNWGPAMAWANSTVALP